MYTVVQVRNVPGEWDGWAIVDSRGRVIASSTYKREMIRSLTNLLSWRRRWRLR